MTSVTGLFPSSQNDQTMRFGVGFCHESKYGSEPVYQTSSTRRSCTHPWAATQEANSNEKRKGSIANNEDKKAQEERERNGLLLGIIRKGDQTRLVHSRILERVKTRLAAAAARYANCFGQEQLILSLVSPVSATFPAPFIYSRECGENHANNGQTDSRCSDSSCQPFFCAEKG